MLARAMLALMLSGAVVTGTFELYPAALGVLVASKAYGVVRSAVVPRLLPPTFSLVKANSRVTLGGLLATGVAGPIAVLLHSLGARYPLYGAFTIFIAGTFLSFSLPPKVDSAKGEDTALLAADPDHLHGPRLKKPPRPGLRTVGTAVTHALGANASLRCLSGFLIFFLAFLLRESPLTGKTAAVSLGLVVVSAGVGNAIGTAVGAWLKQRSPEIIIVTVVAVVLATAITAALFFGTLMVACLAAIMRLRPGPRQTVPGRPDPARRPRTCPEFGLRTLRDAAPDGLGARRSRRYRDAAQRPARPLGGGRDRGRGVADDRAGTAPGGTARRIGPRSRLLSRAGATHGTPHPTWGHRWACPIAFGHDLPAPRQSR